MSGTVRESILTICAREREGVIEDGREGGGEREREGEREKEKEREKESVCVRERESERAREVPGAQLMGPIFAS